MGQVIRSVLSGVIISMMGAVSLAQDAPSNDRQVSFQEVLEKPGDISLNVNYARQQLRQGDLKEASATLERILLLHPKQADVRILYGLIQYRLGLLSRARFALEKALESPDLPALMRQEAEDFIARIKGAERKTRGSIGLTIGAQWDQNIRQATSSGERLFNDIIINAAESVNDVSLLTILSGHISHDIGTQSEDRLEAEAVYYRSDRNDNILNTEVISLAVGGLLKVGQLSIRPRLRGGYIEIDDQTFFRRYGAGLDLNLQWDSGLQTYLRFTADDETFVIAPDLSGIRTTAVVGAQWRASPVDTLTVETFAMNKQGEADFETFIRYGIYGAYNHLFSRGAFAGIAVTAQQSDYDDNNPAISSIIRDESLYRARLSAGAPLSFFLGDGILPAAVSDINILTQYTYETVDSNLLNFEYEAERASVLFSKRISF